MKNAVKRQRNVKETSKNVKERQITLTRQVKTLKKRAFWREHCTRRRGLGGSE